MRFRGLRVFLLGATLASLISGVAAYGQELVQVTPRVLRQQRDEYIQAMQEWQHGDTTLEKDLHTQDRKSLLERIDKEAERTSKFLDSKKTYFGSLRQYYQEQYRRVEGAVGSGAKPPETKEEIQDHIDGVAQELVDVNASIDRTTSPEVRQKLAMQATALKAIQDNLQEQKVLVYKWEQSTTGIAQARKAMLGNLRKIMDVLTEQESGTDEAKAQLNRIYASMREVAGTPLKQESARRRSSPSEGQGPAVASPQATAEPPKPVQPVQPIRTPSKAGGHPATATAPSFSGSWAFAARPGESNKPQSIQLLVVEENGRITGNLQATQIPKSLGLPQTVSFPFSGPQGGKFRWAAGNQEGVLELIFDRPGRIELVWRTDRNMSLIFDDYLARQ